MGFVVLLRLSFRDFVWNLRHLHTHTQRDASLDLLLIGEHFFEQRLVITNALRALIAHKLLNAIFTL